MDHRRLADQVLRGTPVSREEALALLSEDDDRLLELLDAAFAIRRARFGRGVLLHVLHNAKSGSCTETCAYCSQSALSTTPIPHHPLQPVETLLAGARRAHQAGAARYCLVASGRGPSAEETERIVAAVRRIKAELPLSVCVSLGALDEQSAAALRAAGVDRYNHNLETSARYFPSICSTHSYADRIATARLVKAVGLELCSGALLGLGERPEDRVDLALALRELAADSIPVNFLDPRPGTPLAGATPLRPTDALRALAMFRFVNPAAEIRVAGGRERILGPLQALALYPANSLFTEGYLTTPGQGLRADLALIEALGFHVAGLAE